jgi:hypothetical protein
MEQKPHPETAICQPVKNPALLWNPKACLLVHKHLPLVPILNRNVYHKFSPYSVGFLFRFIRKSDNRCTKLPEDSLYSRYMELNKYIINYRYCTYVVLTEFLTYITAWCTPTSFHYCWLNKHPIITLFAFVRVRSSVLTNMHRFQTYVSGAFIAASSYYQYFWR